MVREIKPTFNGSTTYNVGCEKKLVSLSNYLKSEIDLEKRLTLNHS
jgi:hypothetical protein